MNFSTKRMRGKGGLAVIRAAVHKLRGLYLACGGDTYTLSDWPVLPASITDAPAGKLPACASEPRDPLLDPSLAGLTRRAPAAFAPPSALKGAAHAVFDQRRAHDKRADRCREAALQQTEMTTELAGQLRGERAYRPCKWCTGVTSHLVDQLRAEREQDAVRLVQCLAGHETTVQESRAWRAAVGGTQQRQGTRE